MLSCSVAIVSVAGFNGAPTRDVCDTSQKANTIASYNAILLTREGGQSKRLLSIGVE